MSDTPFQPVIPDDTSPLEDAEATFMEEEPPNLFPQNRESNFGLKRKIWTNDVQQLIDQLDTIYGERFVETSTIHLDEWEKQVGLPQNVVGLTTGARRSRILARLKKGAFTRLLRDSIIEAYLAATFGDPAQFSPDGIPLDAAGIPLYAGSTSPSQLYRTYVDFANFSYEVWIRNDVTPDLASLTRELARVTPSGWQFTIDNTKANVLDYMRAVRTLGPSAHWRLDGNANDSGGLGLNGVGQGGVVFTGAALPQNAAGNSGNFDGTDDFVLVPDHPVLRSPYSFSIEAWANPDLVNGALRIVVRKGSSTAVYALQLNSSNKWQFTAFIDGNSKTISSIDTVVAGTTYHLVGVYDGEQIALYVDGIKRVKANASGALSQVVEDLSIGAAPSNAFRFDGRIDEVAAYSYALTEERIFHNYSVGLNVA